MTFLGLLMGLMMLSFVGIFIALLWESDNDQDHWPD